MVASGQLRRAVNQMGYVEALGSEVGPSAALLLLTGQARRCREPTNGANRPEARGWPCLKPDGGVDQLADQHQQRERGRRAEDVRCPGAGQPLV